MYQNYNFGQRALHELCLSSRKIRRYCFDFERDNFLNGPTAHDNTHVFVAGLARSGTTALLEALYASGKFGSLTYEDMPFALAPNFWAKLRKKNIEHHREERAHGDGLMVGLDSPEAFEEIFWQSYCENTESNFFQDYVTLILKRRKKDRYLSKNNQNINRIARIQQIFPSAINLIPFRNPVYHAASLIKQHKRFCKLQLINPFIRRYMILTCHSEFGLTYKPGYTSNLSFPDPTDINHWLEQWLRTYTWIFKNFMSYDRVRFVCYENLCREPQYWQDIQKLVDIKSVYNFIEPERQKLDSIPFDKNLMYLSNELYTTMINH